MEQYHELFNIFHINNKTIINFTANTSFHIGRYLPKCPPEYNSLVDIIPIIWTWIFHLFFWIVTLSVGFIILLASMLLPLEDLALKEQRKNMSRSCIMNGPMKKTVDFRKQNSQSMSLNLRQMRVIVNEGVRVVKRCHKRGRWR